MVMGGSSKDDGRKCPLRVAVEVEDKRAGAEGKQSVIAVEDSRLAVASRE